jgi:hypothetical protein
MSGVAIFMFTDVRVLLRVPVCRHLHSKKGGQVYAGFEVAAQVHCV